MPGLLLEVGCEELPASACREAEEQLPGLAARVFGAEPEHIFVTPRRLALLFRDVPDQMPDEWIKGPPEAMREQAAAGFARRHGVEPAELQTRDGHLWARRPGKPLREVVSEHAAAVVGGLAFSKSMRWDGAGRRFARPVRWTLMLLGDEVLQGTVSYGRRFAHGEVEIPNAEAYAGTLRAAGVEPDAS